jgi:hypothetical protein
MLQIKFKENVYGFVYDTIYGDIINVITKPVTEEQVKFFNDTNEDHVLFNNTEELPELFGIEEIEDVENEYWGEILEVIK